MGERGSITVGKEGWTFNRPPVLFRHWGGHHDEMQELVDRLREALPPEGTGDPYTRRDPDAVMALLVKLAVESDEFSAYLGRAEHDGDNSDNGHYLLDLDTFTLRHMDRPFGCAVCEELGEETSDGRRPDLLEGGGGERDGPGAGL